MLSLVHYHPWPLTPRWHHELERVFTLPTGASGPDLDDAAPWTPSVDVQEQDDAFLVRADIPGVAAKDIEVTTDGGVLTIRGERKSSNAVAGAGFESIERVAGAFMRRITLPDGVQTADIHANYTNGVLEIRIPKTPRVEPTRIPVTVN